MGLLKRLMEMEKRYTIRSVLKEKYGIEQMEILYLMTEIKLLLEYENGRIIDSEEIFR